MATDLTVELAGLRLASPVLTASGTFGSGREYGAINQLKGIGAIVTKTITYGPKQGNPPPRIWETASGMLNSIGLQNDGVEAFINKDMPFLVECPVPIVVSIGGEDVDEYCRVAKRLSQVEGISALEVNISCPNVKEGGLAFGMEATTAAALVGKVRTSTHLPLIVKLTPNISDIVPVAAAVERAGASAISLINTILGMAIDIETRRPRLATVVGGLSGPAIKPVALRMVWRVAQAVGVPVIGMGGISCANDALEFLIAGASAVGVGTAMFTNPMVAGDITDGIAAYLEEKRVTRLSKIVGTLKV